MKNDPIQAALERLDQTPLHTPEGRNQMVKALAAKSNLVVAKAAQMLGRAQWTELAGDLEQAFERQLRGGDKGCTALVAIARALILLEHDGAELFLKGMRHVQMEPGWGASADAAAELRAVSAMGLAGSTYSWKLREMVTLLADEHWPARAGAARAIAEVGGESASLLLRFKALEGDKETDVVADCFEGLLALEGAEAVEFLASFVRERGGETAEAAILALGASRRVDAVDWLMGRLGQTADAGERKAILLALSTSRTKPAIGFLLDLVRTGSRFVAAEAVDALTLHRADEHIMSELAKAQVGTTR